MAFQRCGGDAGQTLQGLGRPAIVYRCGGEDGAFGKVGRPVRYHERGGGVQQHDVAVGAGRTRQQSAQGDSVLLGVAATDVCDGGAGQAGVLGRDLETANRAVLPFRDFGRSRGRQFVQALAMHGPGSRRAKAAKHLGQGLQQAGIIDAHDLAFRRRRV